MFGKLGTDVTCDYKGKVFCTKKQEGKGKSKVPQDYALVIPAA
jgi:hypothetical protein